MIQSWQRKTCFSWFSTACQDEHTQEMVQVLPKRQQSTTLSLESFRKWQCKKPPTQTEHLSETNSASICDNSSLCCGSGRKQSSYPGALCTKPRTTASIQRSGTHSTNCQHILCQMQSDLVRSVRRGTKTPRISSEVQEKTAKTQISRLVQWHLRLTWEFQDLHNMKKIQCTVWSSKFFLQYKYD